MRCRRVDRNNDIQIFNECGGIRKIVEFAGEVEKIALWPVFQLPAVYGGFRRVSFLKTEKIRMGRTQRACENIQRNISARIGGPEFGLVGAKTAVPDHTDLQAATVAYFVAPMVHLGRISAQIGARGRNGGQRGAERKRQAHQGAVVVKAGQAGPPLDELIHPGKSRKQAHERARHFEQNMGTGIFDPSGIAGKLDAIAQTLFGMQQYGFVCQRFSTQPKRCGEVALGAGRCRAGPARFIQSPACLEITQLQ